MKKILIIHLANSDNFSHLPTEILLPKGNWEHEVFAFANSDLQTASLQEKQLNRLKDQRADAVLFVINEDVVDANELLSAPFPEIFELAAQIAPIKIAYFEERVSEQLRALKEILPDVFIFSSAATLNRFHDFLLTIASRDADQLTIRFSPDLSPHQITETLTALANYFRACGGVGLAAEFELEEAQVFSHVS